MQRHLGSLLPSPSKFFFPFFFFGSGAGSLFPPGVRAGPWAKWSAVREPLERKTWLWTGLFGALHRSKEGPVTQHRQLRLGFATSPQVAAQTPAFGHSSGPAQGQVPPWRELLHGYRTAGPCSSLLRGLRQDWEPQREDNNPGKKPSFYNLVMGSASFRHYFPSYIPTPTGARTSKQVPECGLFHGKSGDLGQPGVKKMFSSPHPLPQSSSSPCRSEGPETAGHKDITEPYIRHRTYRSDGHMQVRDGLGTSPRQGLV